AYALLHYPIPKSAKIKSFAFTNACACLICGDDILASSARCRLAACLYGFNVTRSLSKVTICLKKSFTCVFQRLIELMQPPEATELCMPCPDCAADCVISETSPRRR